MNKAADLLQRWIDKNRNSLTQMGCTIEMHWSDEPSPNKSAYIDGEFGDLLFRIVVWELGNTELQFMQGDDEDSMVIIDTEADGGLVEDRLDQHLQTVLAALN